MTMEELRAKYTVAYRIIVRERTARDQAFAARQSEPNARMADMDILLEVIDELKDELKRRISEEPTQATLLDVVQKASYP